jgi:hypothetical protein
MITVNVVCLRARDRRTLCDVSTPTPSPPEAQP